LNVLLFSRARRLEQEKDNDKISKVYCESNRNLQKNSINQGQVSLIIFLIASEQQTWLLHGNMCV